MTRLWPFLLLPSFILPLVSAYSWKFTNNPVQCQNISIWITGAGTPPYRVLMIPFGPSPLPNNIEARRLYSIDFSGNQDKISFELRYPANSQFVAVVSDSSGFGSGGTSVAAQVLAGPGDSSCFDATTNVSPAFVFNLEPPNQIVQCARTRIWWDKATVLGTTQFMGVIPGGQSFQIANADLTDVPNQGTGFNWTPSVRGGTTLIVVAGDGRGVGSGGSVLNTVGFGTSPESGCLSDNSPSSTPGNPAGGSYPTNSMGAQTPGNGGDPGKGSSHSRNNVGAIVGAVAGVIALIIALVLAFFHRRRVRANGSTKEVPIDLLQDQDNMSEHERDNGLPPHYQPEPFMVPDPTATSRSSYDPQGQRLSMTTTTDGPGFYNPIRSPTPDGALRIGGQPSGVTSTSRKSAGGPRIMRPVNIIQHDDAGPSVASPDDEEPQTIELPPAYTNIKKSEVETGPPLGANS